MPMKLKDGCPGCNRKWGEGEGQCSRCRRCLECCGKEKAAFSCAANWERKSDAQKARSRKAYERWQENPNILGHNRRIV